MTSSRIVLAAALLAAALASAAAAQGPSSPPQTAAAARPGIDAATRREVIEGVLAKLRERYVFPEVAREVERAIRARAARGEYDALADGEAFAARLTADLLAVSHDKHLGVTFSAEPLPAVGAERTRDARATEAWRQGLARRNFGVPAVEVLPGNLGYVRLTNFFPAQLAGETYAAAMRFVAGTDALILDLRGNWGGAGDMVAYVLSYLLPERTHLNDFYMRVENTTSQVWTLPYVPGGRYAAERPVYVLTDSVTISAAEEAAYDLQVLKRATLVGEVTAGAANPGGSERLNDHFAVFVPLGRAINPVTHTNWEGVGVKPDVAVPGARPRHRTAAGPARAPAARRRPRADGRAPRRDRAAGEGAGRGALIVPDPGKESVSYHAAPRSRRETASLLCVSAALRETDLYPRGNISSPAGIILPRRDSRPPDEEPWRPR